MKLRSHRIKNYILVKNEHDSRPKNPVKFIEQVDKRTGKRHLAGVVCFDFQITFCKVFHQSLLKTLGCQNKKKGFTWIKIL